MCMKLCSLPTSFTVRGPAFCCSLNLLPRLEAPSASLAWLQEELGEELEPAVWQEPGFGSADSQALGRSKPVRR